MTDKIKMIGFVLVLASVLTGLLLIVDAYTAPIIERNEAIKTRTSILGALDIPLDGKDLDAVFAENVKEEVREVSADGKTAKVPFYVTGERDVAFTISGSGLQGPIKAVLAVRPDRKTIKGITIIRQEETPGLGSRIAEKEYLDKFRGQELLPEIVITPPGKASGKNQVDGLTGATRSCEALQKMLNSEAKKYLPIAGDL